MKPALSITPDGDTKGQGGERTCPRSHSQEQSPEFQFQVRVFDWPVNVPQEREATEPQGQTGQPRPRAVAALVGVSGQSTPHSLLPRLAPVPQEPHFPGGGVWDCLPSGRSHMLSRDALELGPLLRAAAGFRFLIHPWGKYHFLSGRRGPARWMQLPPQPPAPREGF